MMDFDDGVEWEDNSTERENIGEHNSTRDVLIISPNGNEDRTDSETCVKKKRERLPHSDMVDGKNRAISKHQAELKQLSKDIHLRSRACSDPLVMQLVTSLIPQEDLKYDIRSIRHIEQLMHLLLSNFEILDSLQLTVDEGRDGSKVKGLMTAIANLAGTTAQFTQLFISLLRGVGIPTRFVSTLNPMPPKASEYFKRCARRRLILDRCSASASTAIYNQEATTPSDSYLGSTAVKRSRDMERESVNLDYIDDDDDREEVEDEDEFASASYCWLEVLLKQEAENCNGNNLVMDLSGPMSSVLPIAPNTPFSVAQSDNVSCDGGTWTPVDVAHRKVNQPTLPEQTMAKHKQIYKHKHVAYVLAVDNDGLWTDVTMRYASNPQATRALRLQGDSLSFWTDMILENNEIHLTKKISAIDYTSTAPATYPIPALSSITCGSSPLQLNFREGDREGKRRSFEHTVDSTTRVVRDMYQEAEREARKLEECKSFAEAVLPRTFKDFKNHALYVLARDIPSNQALRPAAVSKGPVALFKGEKVYLREGLSELLSATAWRRRGRVVVDEEVPHMWSSRGRVSGGGEVLSRAGRGTGTDVDRKGRGSVVDQERDQICVGNGGEEDGSERRVGLYGDWQTKPFQKVVPIDGVIPVNEYGNVEVWYGNPLYLPEGTSHVTDEGAQAAAKILVIPFAPALVDFETSNGRRVPKVDGVVVFTRDEEIVREAAASLTYDKRLRAAAKKEGVLVKRWERVVKMLLSREDLRRKYGH